MRLTRRTACLTIKHNSHLSLFSFNIKIPIQQELDPFVTDQHVKFKSDYRMLPHGNVYDDTITTIGQRDNMLAHKNNVLNHTTFVY